MSKHAVDRHDGRAFGERKVSGSHKQVKTFTDALFQEKDALEIYKKADDSRLIAKCDRRAAGDPVIVR